MQIWRLRHRIRSKFLFTGGSYGKNVIIFGADMSLSVHVANEGKDILIFGEIQHKFSMILH